MSFAWSRGETTPGLGLGPPGNAPFANRLRRPSHRSEVKPPYPTSTRTGATIIPKPDRGNHGPGGGGGRTRARISRATLDVAGGGCPTPGRALKGAEAY